MIMDMGKIKQGNAIVPWQVGANLGEDGQERPTEG